MSSSQTVKALLNLRELILDGQLAAGQRISELAMVERLGVSRTPVRAALVRLREEGLLDVAGSGGYLVRAFSEADIHDAIEVRGTMEGLAARLAAERVVNPSQLAELRVWVANIDRVLADGDLTDEGFARYIECNNHFHGLMAKLPGSSVIEREIARAVSLPFASPNGFVALQAVMPDAREVLVAAHAQHCLVIEAIEQRQGTRAEAIMREHARIAHRNLRSALQGKPHVRLIRGASLIT